MKMKQCIKAESEWLTAHGFESALIFLGGMHVS
jgi:hypothetical protein